MPSTPAQDIQPDNKIYPPKKLEPDSGNHLLRMVVNADFCKKIFMSNSIENSKAFVPANNIEYASGSVVSKTILKKPVGNITLFAFDQGEGLSEHSSPYEALVQLLDGEAEITVGGTSYTVKAGETFMLPANIPHALKANVRFKMMLTMIKG